MAAAKKEVASTGLDLLFIEDFTTGVNTFVADMCDTFVEDMEANRAKGSERAVSIVGIDNENLNTVVGYMGEAGALGYTMMTCPMTFMSAASRAISK